MEQTELNRPLLSVIVPVYKAEATLDACVESIVTQGIERLQVILIVDGSPDASGALCDAWAAQDSRVTVIHQPNQGVSAARNAGLAAATGQYITFVDSDDRLLPGVYARALPAMEREGLGVYVYAVQFSDGTVPWPLEAARYEALPELAPQLERLVVDTGIVASLYNKVFRAGLLDGLRFDEQMKVNEDLKLNLEILARPELGPIRFDPEPGYWYEAFAAGSLSRRMRTDLLEVEERSRPAYLAFLRAAELDEEGKARMLTARRRHACLCQYALLTGPGKVDFSTRKALFGEILADPAALAALREQTRRDPNRLMAIPYRVCLALRSPLLLAVFCVLKGLRPGG